MRRVRSVLSRVLVLLLLLAVKVMKSVGDKHEATVKVMKSVGDKHEASKICVISCFGLTLTVSRQGDEISGR
ncbi:hypothetical protein RRG08_023501 [Elysia crispata]|uniref:Uncharacterized protein n=1 Tax=Elysia crispata TaxID=231223 RepID=A0AAE0YY35_9GAST|nr:hypothetical protein RRG08_023501 [Elysia crispata]